MMGGIRLPPNPQLSLSSRRKPEDGANYITVSDPVQHAEGVNKYTSYRVDVRPQNSDLSSTQNFSAVLRRYSDFLWLYEKLQTERSGTIVPPLPGKAPVGRFNPAFVEARRRELERFLRRSAVHPELQDCPCLDVFLRADDVTFYAAKNSKSDSVGVMQQSGMIGMANNMLGTTQMPTSPTKKEGFKRWFAETKTSISGDLVKSPDDALFDEIQRYIHTLDQQMKNVATQASGLVRKGKEMANGLFEFGLAFNLLGQSEADALGEALCQLGETADRLSVLSAEHSDQEGAQFEDPLVDMIKMIYSVKLALHKRHEKRLTYSTCLQQVEAKNLQLSKLRAQIGMESKAYSLEMSLRRAHENAEGAREDFATVSQRVLREVDRFKRDTAEDMRLTVLDYIRMQVDYNKKMERIWASLIPQLERVQLDPNANVIDATNGSQHIINSSISNPQQAHMQTVVPAAISINNSFSAQSSNSDTLQHTTEGHQDPTSSSVQYRQSLPTGNYGY